MRGILSKYELEREKLRNKKTKGGVKKNRDKMSSLQNKIAQLKQVKERAEELQLSMDYLEGGKLMQLRSLAKQLNQNSDDELIRNNTLQELDMLIELSEQNRRVFYPQSNSLFAGSDGSKESKSLQLVQSLDVKDAEDIMTGDQLTVTELLVASILDAQDYLGSWHLAIVIDEKEEGTSWQKSIHFLPFQKSNRDEWFTAADDHRLAPAFSRQDASGDPA